MCVGMGIQVPQEKVLDLRPVGIKFPSQASVIFTQQLFHYYFEVVSDTSSVRPDTTGISALLRYQQRSRVLLDQLHRSNILNSCIEFINLRQPSHSSISRMSAGDRRSEALATQLYHAFRSAGRIWTDYFNDLPNIRPIVEARSDAEYKATASLICNTAQRYLWNMVLTKHSLTGWSRWIQVLVRSLDDYEFWEESAAAFVREHNEDKQFYHLIILLCLLSTNWEPPNLTLEELDQHIRDQDVIDLLDGSTIVQHLNLYAFEDYVGSQSIPFMTLRLLACLAPSPLSQWCSIPDLYEDEAPMMDTLLGLLESIRHYTQRRLNNFSSETAMTRLEEIPAEPQEGIEVIDIEITITRFKDTSPNPPHSGELTGS